MAKSKNRQKGSLAGRIAAVVLCVLLLAVVGLAGAWGTGFALTGKANPTEWTLSEKPNADKPSGTPTDGMTVSAYSSDNLRLQAMPMTANAGYTDSSYYLKATLEPADAWETEVVWTIEFKDPLAAWASGKSAGAYVSVTPSSDTHNATVTCLGAFGEQINVIVRSKDNPAASATCTCDYVKRVSNINFDIGQPSFDKMTYTYDFEYTPYTVDSEVKLTQAKIQATYGFVNDIANRINWGSVCGGNLPSDYTVNAVSVSPKNFAIDNSTSELNLTNGFYDIVYLSKSYSDESDDYYLTDNELQEVKAAYRQAVKSSLSSYSGVQAELTFSYSVIHDGTNYGTGSNSVNVNFNYNTIKVPVTNVKLNTSSIIF